MPDPTVGLSETSASKHRIVVEFDDGAYTLQLIHPEGGCLPGEHCGQCGRSFDDNESDGCYDCKGLTGPQECWVQGWYDEHGAELLRGKIEVTVDAEWDVDICTLHVVDVAMPQEAPHA